MWLAWITDNASATSLLISGAVAVGLAADAFVPTDRSGLGGRRRADRLCWAIMIAGTHNARMRKRIPGTKDLFLTRPPKTVYRYYPLVERQIRLPGSRAKRGGQNNMKRQGF